jgi:hypothetical protein
VTSVREAILDANRLKRMRMGQEAPEMVDIPSMPEVRAAQVPLTEAEAQKGVVLAAGADVNDNAAGLQVRNRIAVASDVWHSLREPGDPEKRIFSTIEEMQEALSPSDIDYLADHLIILSEYASPSIDGISEEQLSELKKDFVETDWSALTGRRWAALKLAISTLFPELLQVRSRGGGSTDSSTPTSENVEST